MDVRKLPALFLIAVVNALTFSPPPTGPCRPGCSAQDVPDSLIRSMDDACALASPDDPFFYLNCFIKGIPQVSCLGRMKIEPELLGVKEQCTTSVELFCCRPGNVTTAVPTVEPVTAPPPNITSTCGNPERATTAAEIIEILPGWVAPAIVAGLFLGLAVGAISYRGWISRKKKTQKRKQSSWKGMNCLKGSRSRPGTPSSGIPSGEDSRSLVGSITGDDANDVESGFGTTHSLSHVGRTGNSRSGITFQDFSGDNSRVHYQPTPANSRSMDPSSPIVMPVPAGIQTALPGAGGSLDRRHVPSARRDDASDQLHRSADQLMDQPFPGIGDHSPAGVSRGHRGGGRSTRVLRGGVGRGARGEQTTHYGVTPGAMSQTARPGPERDPDQLSVSTVQVSAVDVAPVLSHPQDDNVASYRRGPSASEPQTLSAPSRP